MKKKLWTNEEISDMIDLYTSGKSLRKIAEMYKSNHKMIARVISSAGVKIDSKKRSYLEVENELEIAEYLKNHSLNNTYKKFGYSPDFLNRIRKKYNITPPDRVSPMKGKHLTEEQKKHLSLIFKGRKKRKLTDKEKKERANNKELVVGFLLKKRNIDASFFQNFNDMEKLRMLSCFASRLEPKNDDFYIKFINKFYNDEKFNIILSEYRKTKNRLKKPSVDHIIPVSKGGTNDLDNLRFITYFENLARNNTDLEEWEEIKKNIGEYFI